MIDDRALLRASAGGDARAFGQFMTAHQAAVHRFLVAGSEPDVDCDDALQETFIAAWKGADGYTGAASARAWLYGIARNIVRHQRRRRVGAPAQLESIDQLAEQAGWGYADPSSAFEDITALRDLLSVAIAQLIPEEREILTLRDIDGFTGEEAAALLQLSLPAAKSRLHRARLHLAAIIHALEHQRAGPASESTHD